MLALNLKAIFVFSHCASNRLNGCGGKLGFSAPDTSPPSLPIVHAPSNLEYDQIARSAAGNNLTGRSTSPFPKPVAEFMHLEFKQFS